MKQAIEAALRKRFVKLHGEGEAHQADLYRCTVCARLITWNKLRRAEVCCQGHVVPTEPTFFESLKLLVFP